MANPYIRGLSLQDIVWALENDVKIPELTKECDEHDHDSSGSFGGFMGGFLLGSAFGN